MVLLQPRLNLKVTQKQILTPGLVQMVSVLALNKIELKDMINAEMVENPVLEELDGTVPLLDEVAGREEDRERAATVSEDPIVAKEGKDPFDEIDFGSFFQDYLDPGYRSPEGESVERPSFENFISKPTTLTDHLLWQLGSMSHVSPAVSEAAELVIGNLSEDGYLTASDEELMSTALYSGPAPAAPAEALAPQPEAMPAGDNGSAATEMAADFLSKLPVDFESAAAEIPGIALSAPALPESGNGSQDGFGVAVGTGPVPQAVTPPEAPVSVPTRVPTGHVGFTLADLHEAIALVRQMDPVGVASRDLRECLLAQLRFHQQQLAEGEEYAQHNGDTAQVLADALALVDSHLRELQNKQFKEIAKALGRPLEAINAAVDFIKTLDPRPGLRYNQVSPRLIEPDVAFIKQGDEYMVVLNDDDVPQLRLNTSYKRLLNRDAAEKDVRNYVKERYKSAIQLIKNIEQRKQTILKVCYAIVARQKEFLDHGIDQLKPMMIKEVAEEIGVHPSTVSRAVANKYAHTAQGVFELRYFFSESVNGPEGGNTSLLILKRRVKKLIEEEDRARPLTDEQITRILLSQCIQVTRRTVAKYRDDMNIPSTHQRRVKN